MNPRTLAYLVSVIVVLAASQGHAQQRRREITWVNPDIPKMAGLTHKVLESKLMVLEDTNHNLGKYYERAGDTMLEFLAEQLTGDKKGT